MTKSITGLLAGAAVLAVGVPAMAQDSGRPISVTLTDEAEVDPGDPTGTGTFEARINPGTRQFCYTLTATLASPPTTAHVHLAPENVAGPVVIPLLNPLGGSSTECRTIDRELAQAIIRNPEAYYVNVHNAPFPGGAIRAQLSK